MASEPSCAGWIKLPPSEVAQERNGIAFNVPAQTVRAGSVRHGKIQKSHGAQNAAHLTLERDFFCADGFGSVASLAPTRMCNAVAVQEGRADDESEYRPSVVSSET